MANINFESIKKEIESGKYSAVYFLQGDDQYHISILTDYFENKILDSSEKSFDQVVMYGRDTSISQIITYSRRAPMMSSKQVVIIKEAQDITDLGRESGKDLLSRYLEHPNPKTILVFIHNNKTIDARSSIAKKIQKYGNLITFKKPYDNQLPTWIEKIVGEKGYQISPKATSMIVEEIGNDLKRISNEIDKVIINIKNNNNNSDKILIDDVIVQKYIGLSKDYNMFELQKAIIEKNPAKAFKILNYFEANPKNNPIIPMISLLYTLFAKLIHVHTSKDKSKAHLASILKVNPYFVTDYIRAANQYSLKKIIENIDYLHEADLKTKNIERPATPESEIAKELVTAILA